MDTPEIITTVLNVLTLLMARNKSLTLTYSLAFLIISVVLLCLLLNARPVKAEMFNPYIGSKSITITKVEVVETPVKPSQEEVKSYLKEIFGKDWRVAWAVSQAECNYNRPEWPKCKLSWRVEHSVGIFQINLAKNEGLGPKVHWEKVPGDNLEEKEEWLSSWKNNVLIAYKIYSDSGFRPWTAWLNGSYKKFI